MSGLSPSPNKSHIFFPGYERKLRDEIMGILKFLEGLPVRYLGFHSFLPNLGLLTVSNLLRELLRELRIGLTNVFLMPRGYS